MDIWYVTRNKQTAIGWDHGMKGVFEYEFQSIPAAKDFVDWLNHYMQIHGLPISLDEINRVCYCMHPVIGKVVINEIPGLMRSVTYDVVRIIVRQEATYYVTNQIVKVRHDGSPEPLVIVNILVAEYIPIGG